MKMYKVKHSSKQTVNNNISKLFNNLIQDNSLVITDYSDVYIYVFYTDNSCFAFDAYDFIDYINYFYNIYNTKKEVIQFSAIVYVDSNLIETDNKNITETNINDFIKNTNTCISEYFYNYFISKTATNYNLFIE